MVASSGTVPVAQSLSPHDYSQFSSQYSQLKIEKSYFLAFRAAAELLEKHCRIGTKLLDFGCGTGRSTRFMKTLGFESTGVDISQDMLEQARQADQGEYCWLESTKIPFPERSFDVIFQSFVLLEYSSLSQMVDTFEEFNRVLQDDGIAIIVTGSEDYYRNDWLSFKMGESDENGHENVRPMTSGDKVKVAITDTDIVLFDYVWTNSDYQQVFQKSGFDVIDMVSPLAQGNEPFEWVNECEVPCWTIYVLKKQSANP
ncbi:MAG: class I SAM-dependent methyltransferase [Phormidesmis sp.]